MSGAHGPARAPTLDDDPVLAEWAADVAARLAAGEPVDLQPYRAQDVERAERLGRLLPTLTRLARFTDGHSFSGRSARPSLADEWPEARVLGDFRLIREIGRGGMGIVYEAVQRSLGRHVALKVLAAAGALDARQVKRFEVEAQAAALLQHGRIVPVYAVGCERGVPYYAMQLIVGRSLAAVIGGLAQALGPAAAETRALGQTTAEATTQETLAPAAPDRTREREDAPATAWGSDMAGEPSSFRAAFNTHEHVRAAATLGLQAAEALAYAHEQGIVHRDIKPANLLVDARGDAWITDFGLARIEANPTVTSAGVMFGTLRYMSPEQAGARRTVVDHRTDVYSLGASLYELLTLCPAIPGHDGPGILRGIAEHEPAPIRMLNPAVPVDLQTIVMKALAKTVEERYASAGAMADDLRRFLAGEPIHARPVTRREWLVKWARRRPAEAALAGLSAAVIVAIVAAVVQWNVALRRHNAELAAMTATAKRHEYVARRRAYGSQIRRAQDAQRAGDLPVAQWLLHDLRDEQLGFEWHYLRRVAQRDITYLFGHHAWVGAMALSPDGLTLASGDENGTVIVRDTAALREPYRLQSRPIVQQLAFTRNGKTLASRAVDAHGRTSEVKLWDLATGSERGEVASMPGFEDAWLALAPDSRWLAVGHREWPAGRPPQCAVSVWDLTRGGSPARSRIVPDCLLADYSPDGQWLATVSWAGTVMLRDPETWLERKVLPETVEVPVSLRFSADSHTLAVVGARGPVFWTVPQGARAAAGSSLVTSDFAFAPNTSRFAYSRYDPAAKMGELVTGDPTTEPPTFRVEPIPGTKHRVAFSSDGERLAIAGDGMAPMLRELGPASRQSELLSPPAEPARLLFSKDGSALFMAGDGPRIRCWRLEARPEPMLPLEGHQAEVWSLAYLADGTLASAGDDHLIKLWNTGGGTLRTILRDHTSLVAALSVSPDGGTLASASFDETVRLWDTRTWKPRAVLRGHVVPLRAVAISPGGRFVASGGGKAEPYGTPDDYSIRVWEVQADRPPLVLRGHTDQVRALAFAPAGDRLASVGNELNLRLWDVRTWRQIRSVACPSKPAALAFSPDGSIIATAGERGEIAFWDSATLSQRAWFKGSDACVRAVGFSPDGLTLAAASDDAKIRLWETTTAQEMVVLEGHSVRVNAVAFSPDGLTLTSGSHDGEVKLWRAGAR